MIGLPLRWHITSGLIGMFLTTFRHEGKTLIKNAGGTMEISTGESFVLMISLPQASIRFSYFAIAILAISIPHKQAPGFSP